VRLLAILLLVREGIAGDWRYVDDTGQWVGAGVGSVFTPSVGAGGRLAINNTAVARGPGVGMLPSGQTAQSLGDADVEMLPSSLGDTSETAQGNEAYMFAYHKDLWPLNGADLFTMVFAAASLLIASGGGIGGGGILVPLFMIFLKFRPKHAIALSNFATLGGAIANTVFNLQKTDEFGVSLIDWDIIVMMEPSTIAGAVIGSFASKFLPDILLTVSLTIVLGLLAYRTLDKGVKMFQKESEDAGERRGEGHGRLSTEDPEELCSEDEGLNENQGLMGGGDGSSPNNYAATPWRKILLLTLCFVGSITLTVLKGSGHGSVIGVECGSVSFWFLSMAVIPWVALFGARFRKMLINEYDMKRRAGHKFDNSVVQWDSKTTVQYPLICTLAGVFAGLFGVGGGIIKGPLMLEMGVNPVVAAATAATMILFTTTAACVSFEIFGLLEPSYGFACFILGLVCTAVGQGAINAWMRTAKRQSPPVLSIGLVMALSTALVAVEAWEKLTMESWGQLMFPVSVCSRSS